MNATDIKQRSDIHSVHRSEQQQMQARLYKVVDNKIIYTVTASSHTKQYIVTIQLLELTGNKLKSLSDALDGDIKISCTCDAFLYQGFKYITYKRQVGIDRETRAPNKTNPDQKGMACKHILVALNQMKSDYNDILNKIKASLPPDEPKRPVDIKNNNTSDIITEYDLQILDKFNSACHKIYDSYKEYLQANDDAISYTTSKFYDKLDPTRILQNLSKPAKQQVMSTNFIKKLKSIDDILLMINQKDNGFNILLKSDIEALTKKFNALLKNKTESLINSIILTLIGD